MREYFNVVAQDELAASLDRRGKDGLVAIKRRTAVRANIVDRNECYPCADPKVGPPPLEELKLVVDLRKHREDIQGSVEPEVRAVRFKFIDLGARIGKLDLGTKVFGPVVSNGRTAPGTPMELDFAVIKFVTLGIDVKNRVEAAGYRDIPAVKIDIGSSTGASMSAASATWVIAIRAAAHPNAAPLLGMMPSIS